MPPTAESNQPWETLSRTYEGFPLYLRRPANLDFDALAPRFSNLLTVTHKFSFRQFDGTPEPTYNEQLQAFDLAVMRYFVGTGQGQIVLVETFGGERNYYFYVAATINADTVLADLQSRFRGYQLQADSRPDPTWRFIRDYTQSYFKAD